MSAAAANSLPGLTRQRAQAVIDQLTRNVHMDGRQLSADALLTHVTDRDALRELLRRWNPEQWLNAIEGSLERTDRRRYSELLIYRATPFGQGRSLQLVEEALAALKGKLCTQ